jgi:very-short-patch-repair endonuclease
LGETGLVALGGCDLLAAMARTSRRSAVATGQLGNELRNRVSSGFQSVHLEPLRRLIDDIGHPVYTFGRTSAALNSLDGFSLRPPFQLVVPRGRNVVRLGHVVHTSLDLDPIDCEERHGIPVLSPARTLISLAIDTPTAPLVLAIDGALRDLMITERFLHERIAALRSRGRYGIPKLLAAIEQSEIGRGCHSWLEREYLRLLAAARLPRPETQQVLGRRGDSLIRVDFRFPGTPVVVEVLGYRWHRTTAQMSIDAERMNQLVLGGFEPYQFTYQQVVDTPQSVVHTTDRALAPYHRAA